GRRVQRVAGPARARRALRPDRHGPAEVRAFRTAGRFGQPRVQGRQSAGAAAAGARRPARDVLVRGARRRRAVSEDSRRRRRRRRPSGPDPRAGQPAARSPGRARVSGGGRSDRCAPQGRSMAGAAGQPTRVLAVPFGGGRRGALDIAIVGPALPAIQRDLDVDARALSWVFTIYVLFNILGAPLLAKLSDRFGRRDVYAGSLLLFAAGSITVAAAQGFDVLLAGRALQAFGAGGIFPVASAVVADTFPAERRGRALGMIGAVFGIAFLLGPLLGGLLLRWGWQWLFLINVPAVALVIVASRRVLPHESRADRAPFDARGAVALSLMLAAAALGLNRIDAAALPGSLLEPGVAVLLAAALAIAPVFWLIE